jgi:hypothetical protein
MKKFFRCEPFILLPFMVRPPRRDLLHSASAVSASDGLGRQGLAPTCTATPVPGRPWPAVAHVDGIASGDAVDLFG